MSTDPRLTPEKRASSRYWQTLRTQMQDDPRYLALDAQAQQDAVDRAWLIAESEPLSYAAAKVLASLPAPDRDVQALTEQLGRAMDRAISAEAALRVAAEEHGRVTRALAEARAHVEEHRKDAQAWQARANRRAAVLRALHGALMEEDGICPDLSSHPEHSPPCCVRAPGQAEQQPVVHLRDAGGRALCRAADPLVLTTVDTEITCPACAFT